MIDLRSDTVTVPPAGMRQAMADAVVGDDVFGEDPTVKMLERITAELLGKEAGLFVPSGTMGNQIAVNVHTRPADEVILETKSHIFNYESGVTGMISGVQLRPLDAPRGILSAKQVEDAIRPGNYWDPQTRLICVEQTNNKAGGSIYPLNTLQEISAVAQKHNLKTHIDGARIWNATAATGVSEKKYAASFDSVNVCLSKGLGAPIGSVLCGTEAFIQRAHRVRKMLGGGMRQVGIIAAAGIYALENFRDKLIEDHKKAKILATEIALFDCFDIDPDLVESNIVIFETRQESAEKVLEKIKSAGVLMVPFGPNTVRATLHHDITDVDLEIVIKSFKKIF